jgi:hypothetical protein
MAWPCPIIGMAGSSPAMTIPSKTATDAVRRRDIAIGFVQAGGHDVTPPEAPLVRRAPRRRYVWRRRAIARDVACRSLRPGRPPRRPRAAAVLRSLALGVGPVVLRLLPRPRPCLRPAGGARGHARRQGHARERPARRSFTALSAGDPGVHRAFPRFRRRR